MPAGLLIGWWPDHDATRGAVQLQQVQLLGACLELAQYG